MLKIKGSVCVVSDEKDSGNVCEGGCLTATPGSHVQAALIIRKDFEEAGLCT